MPDLTIKNVPFTPDSDNRLRTLKARTGLDRNYLCRLGFCLSLEEPGIPDHFPKDVKAAREIDRYTLLGQHGVAYSAMLHVWMIENQQPTATSSDFDACFVAHMNRGVELVTTRVKSLADIAALLPRETTGHAPHAKNGAKTAT
jgi:DNA sulfur modification protein DndE